MHTKYPLTCLDPNCCCIESKPKCGVETGEEDEEGEAAADVETPRPGGPTTWFLLGTPPLPPDCMPNSITLVNETTPKEETGGEVI